MLGIFVQLIISWGLLRLIEHKGLSVLGMQPTLLRLRTFGVLLMFAGACCALGFLLRHLFGNMSWRINSAISPSLLLNGFWWQLRSVLFEELIFRGAALYILIKRVGVRAAILCSAVGFGVYHWFSYGVFGNPPAMLITFILTGGVGILYAGAYARTGSLYAPAGIHLGWNLVQSYIFPDGPIDATILIAEGITVFRTESLAIYVLISGIPVATLLTGGWALLRRMRTVPANGTRQLMAAP